MNDGKPLYHEVFEAARTGNTERVLELIDVDSSLLDIADSNVNTPLLCAFAGKHLDLVQQLIERGANVFAMNHNDTWSMKLIVRKKDSLKAADRKRLVECVVDTGVCDQEIFHAVWRRDHKAAQDILNNNPSQASVRFAPEDGKKGFYNNLPYCGCSPLHYAVIAGDKRMAKLLLQAGAEVDGVPHGYDKDSYHTPLFYVPGGCKEIAEMLIDFGADPCHSATYLSDGSRAMRKVVIAHGAAGSPLMTALYLRDFEHAIELAKKDASVIHDRLPGSSSGTPLHLAARVGCLEVIDLLIGHGMDVDTPGPDDGDTTLSMASEMYCSYEVIKKLVEYGANVRIDDEKPLYYAVWQHAFGHWNYEKVIRLLVKMGSRPRGLHFCTQAGNFSAAKLLVELGADVNDTRDDGWPGEDLGCTPLDYCTGVAGKQEFPNLAEYLRENGAKHASELQSKTN